MGQDMAPLSELNDYEVADDSIDVRGWTVTTSNGADVGRVHDLIVDRSTMQARYLAVSLEGANTAMTDSDSSRPVLVPVARAHIDENANRVHLDSTGDGLNQLPRYGGAAVDRDYNETFNRTEAPMRSASASTTQDTPQRITRSAEELRIGKRNVSAGEVTVRKHVETERVTEPVTRTREVVNVERRPVSADAAATEISEGEIRVPLVEEEVVVEKRPVVKEEVVITKDHVTETENVEAELREERIEVDGVDETRRNESTRREA